MTPLSSQTLKQIEEIRKRFVDVVPLPGFAIVPNFLDPHLASSILDEALTVPYSTWCGYSPTGRPEDLRAHFCEPNEEAFYVTVHQRPTRAVRLLDEVGRAFASPDSLETLRQMTGLPITAMRPFGSEILTRWPPGSFLDKHTDAGPPDKPTLLVISLSLTKEWRQDYGGSTVFQWDGSHGEVETWPVFNTAVLFRAHRGSTHWVNRIEDHASHDRFTFTLHFT